jgi:hypothetical protein
LELIPCLKLYNCITEMTGGNLAREAFVNTRPSLTRFGNRKVPTAAIAVVNDCFRSLRENAVVGPSVSRGIHESLLNIQVLGEETRG